MHDCLVTLLDEFIHFDRLLAIHALIMHGGENMVDTQNKLTMDHFLDKITSVDPVTSRYVWGPDRNSHELVQVSLTTM